MITQWKKKLTEIRFGKIWWYNFRYDCSFRDLSKDLRRQFYQAIEENLAASKSPTTPLEILNKVLESPDQTFSLKGREACKTERLSCVVPSYAFAVSLIDRDVIGLGTSEVSERIIWEMFERGEIIPEMHYNQKAELKSSRRNFFWATLTSSLDKEFETVAAEFATDVRNLLGLSYLNEGVGLYRIDLPDLPSEIRVCVPTTLDSSPTCVFLPVDKDSSFGRTFHLFTKGSGVEELVISPLPFTLDCKVTQIGFVSEPLPDDDLIWCELEKLVINRWSKKRIRIKVETNSGSDTEGRAGNE